MRDRSIAKKKQHGFSMIEVLITFVILMVGLFGAAGVMLLSQRLEIESYQRVQALIFLDSMVNRITANSYSSACYVTGSSFYGMGSTLTPACTIGTLSQKARAIADMTEWNLVLQGNREVRASANVGSITGARGCVSYDATALTYYVTVAWQGLGDTYAPPASNTCATGLYGTAAQRRIVSAGVRVGALF